MQQAPHRDILGVRLLLFFVILVSARPLPANLSFHEPLVSVAHSSCCALVILGATRRKEQGWHYRRLIPKQRVTKEDRYSVPQVISYQM